MLHSRRTSRSVTKGILKNAGTDTKSTKKTTSTSTSTNVVICFVPRYFWAGTKRGFVQTTGFSDRIQGMGSTSHASSRPTHSHSSSSE
eukprot:1345487-Amorphochlora_amoeboformis.AAC.1